MAARVVVGRVLLAGDDLLGVEELAVRARADLVADRRLEVDVDARGTCLPAPVSEKNVLKASSPPPTVLSEGIWPSGWMPCSRRRAPSRRTALETGLADVRQTHSRMVVVLRWLVKRLCEEGPGVSRTCDGLRRLMSAAAACFQARVRGSPCAGLLGGGDPGPFRVVGAHSGGYFFRPAGGFFSGPPRLGSPPRAIGLPRGCPGGSWGGRGLWARALRLRG